MEGVTVRKTGMRNVWHVYVNGLYVMDLVSIRMDTGVGMTLEDAVANEWRSGSNTNKHILVEIIRTMDLWYEGGEILVEGEYQLVGDHLKEIA